MSKNPSEVASAHGKIAAVKRHNPGSSHKIQDASRDLAAAKLAAYVQQVLATAPPLTPEQRDRISVLLHGNDAEAGQ